MRIATKTFIVVLVCLVGAGLSASVVFYNYSILENSRYQREVSSLALRDVENFRTVISQWFVTIDLFFNERQSYLASGIKKQATQMQEVASVIQSYKNNDNQLEFQEIVDSINNVSISVEKASILTNSQDKQWNLYINAMDDDAIIIIDNIEIIYEESQKASKLASSTYAQKDKNFTFIIWISIAIYLVFVFLSWLWASINIAKPLEVLHGITENAKTEENNNEDLSFLLDKGSKEVIQLSASFQKFYTKMNLAKTKAEKRKQELQESLDQLTKARLQLVQSEKLASVGQLASGVAHEINNPISFISGNFGSLKEYVADIKDVLQKQKESFERLQASDEENPIFSEIESYQEEKDIDFVITDLDDLLKESHTGLSRVKSIVSDLLEFSHVNSPDMVEIEINALLDKTINLLGKDIIKNINIQKQYEDIPKIMGQGAKIGQVLINVLTNAAEFIDKEKGMLSVKTLANKQNIYIDIQDNGCGINEANINRIFDPFYTTKAIGKGTGLGLHTAQSILDSHHGKIQAISKIDVGTKIRITLPKEQKS